jgi:hypothetical protein
MARSGRRGGGEKATKRETFSSALSRISLLRASSVGGEWDDAGNGNGRAERELTLREPVVAMRKLLRRV